MLAEMWKHHQFFINRQLEQGVLLYLKLFIVKNITKANGNGKSIWRKKKMFGTRTENEAGYWGFDSTTGCRKKEVNEEAEVNGRKAEKRLDRERRRVGRTELAEWKKRRKNQQERGRNMCLGCTIMGKSVFKGLLWQREWALGWSLMYLKWLRAA